LGQKEFYGLNFKVNRNTLIPRPETELIPQLVTQNMEPKGKNKKITIVDIGTGSGNIIISIAKEMEKSKLPITNYQLLAIDISAAALKIAKQNARLHKVDKKIKFIKGNLLSPVICNLQFATEQEIIITANLPYLSKKIYASVNRDIKKYEPRSALLSGKNGLAHYEKLLKQLKTLKNQHSMLHVSCFLEISPEQKSTLQKLLKRLFPKTRISFHKDLSSRWRICQIEL
ncbi:MAG TPA: HemK family protein methyltransferase, partial [Patescibacteria group bacterium]